MNVLGLDLSYSSTGVCYPDGVTGRIRIPSVPTRKTNPRYEHDKCDRIRTICDKIDAICSTYGVDLVVLEGFSFNSKTGREEAGGLGFGVRVELAKAGMPWLAVPPASVKKYATGKGNADKIAVAYAVVQRFGGWAPQQSDEIDAFVIWHMAMDADGRPLVELPKTHRSALKAVEWPLPAAGMVGL